MDEAKPDAVVAHGPRKRGRPPKIKPMEGEQPSTQVAPLPETSTNPVPLNEVEELDPMSGDVIARHADAGDAVDMVPTGPDKDYVLTPAQTVALDRDYDGEAGGSWPIAELTELQTKAYAQNAIDAHEGQFEVKVTDGFNRTWAFRHEVVKNHLNVMVECKRGPKVARVFCPTSTINLFKAEEMVRECDAETRR